MKRLPALQDGLYTLFILIAILAVNLLIQRFYTTHTLVPMIFVLGVFLIALRTKGYLWGVVGSLASVFAVNYVFTFPYYAFDFLIVENFFSALVMLAVAITTSTLTTQIKRQEELRKETEMEKMRADLLRAVSHDLRTPLTTIYGSAAVIVENYDTLRDDQHMKLAKEIRDDAEWLTHIVENLLSVTRVGGESMKIIKTPTVLEELIDNVLLKFHKRYPQQAITIDIPDDFVSILMDALLIQQVLINILENAVLHAAGMTELVLSVRLHGKYAEFSVSDDGCGLPKERLDNIFTGYFNESDSTNAGKRRGMGIGLSVCAAIIKAHGSTIHAENLPKGARFYFSLETEAMDYEQ